MPKCVIVILGPGASGKSTLTRTLCGEGGTEGVAEFLIEGKTEKAKYALFPNGAAIAGNIKNGSDSISNMEARALLINQLLDRSDVEFVITDGVRSSKKWDVDWVQANPRDIAAVYVYLDITEEENLRRLMARRESNGKTDFGDKTYQNMLAFRQRAAGVWKAANETYKRSPVKFIRLTEGSTPKDWARQVKWDIRAMFEAMGLVGDGVAVR